MLSPGDDHRVDERQFKSQKLTYGMPFGNPLTKWRQLLLCLMTSCNRGRSMSAGWHRTMVGTRSSKSYAVSITMQMRGRGRQKVPFASAPEVLEYHRPMTQMLFIDKHRYAYACICRCRVQPISNASAASAYEYLVRCTLAGVFQEKPFSSASHRPTVPRSTLVEW